MLSADQAPGGIAQPWLKRIVIAALFVPLFSPGQTNLAIYTDALTNGWQDWSYNVTRNFANPSPVHSGSDSMSATITSAWGGIQLYHADLTNTAYASISFWLNGGATGGQQLQMYGNLDVGGVSTAQSARYHLPAPPPNTWQPYTVALSALGVANTTNFTGFAIQDAAGSTEPTFYLDDLQLNGVVPPPALVHLTINAGQPIRIADARWFGLNAAMWDSYYDTPQTVSFLNQLGTRIIRLPGGSNADDYHWAYNREGANTWNWQTSFGNFIDVITNASVNAQAIITANYGDGTPQEAAAWVAYCNATSTNLQLLGVDAYGTNWQTARFWARLRANAPLGTDDGRNFLRVSRSTAMGFKYWEIGNECYGGWEIDSNTLAHDPYTYAVRATNYISLMKAVDPTIKIGVVATPGEDSSVNNYNHPVVNPRTGQTHYGWTPVLLATLKSLGVMPDFLVHHFYSEYGSDNDVTLLQVSANWASDAANLRQQITDYIGAAGTNIELLITENNADAGNQGKQSTSLVNGLYLADSLAQLTKTEFNSFIWWDLRNSLDTSGDFSASLYGWRTNGDLGIIGSLNTLYPTFYTFKLVQNFVQPGDSVLTAASDYSLLSVYAVRRLNGSLTVLAINKDPVNTFTGQVAVAGYTPAKTATVYSYGMPQDDAARMGIGSPDIAQTNLSGAGTVFNHVFPPYSATVLALSPTPANLLAFPKPSDTNQFIFQLQGQAGVPYVVQQSTNLTTWTSVSTNTLQTATLNFSNAMLTVPSQQFWRAIWQP